MRYSKDKRINTMVKNLVRKGWAFTWGKKHGRLSPPECGEKLTVPKSPSDWRASLNFKRDVLQLTNRIRQQD